MIDACLDVIGESGVAGASHRRVAEAAGVPLGSMTYYFSGMDELLHEEFSRFAGAASDQFAQRMSRASGIDDSRTGSG
jgi:DNA-binding transcriptional regulator YbjK